MLKTKSAALLFSLSPLAASIANAQNDALSLNGFTGIFNIPNAHVTEYGTGVLSYSDMMFFGREYRHNNNVVGSFGILPHVEVNGRIAWFNNHTNLYRSSEPEARDLSANLKINIPFIPDNWFELAIGEQDIGGAASYFDAKYIVASRSFGPLRIDAGVGQNDLNNRLDGVFGGIEFAPYDWISLLAEHDAQDTNAGFRLSTPKSWLPEGARVDLTVLADTSNETSGGRSFYGLNVKFPMGGGFTKERPKPPKRMPVAKASALSPKPAALLYAQNKFRRTPTRKTTLDTPNHYTNTPQPATSDRHTTNKIANILENKGFERINVGVRNNTLIVAFENNIYNQSELDALGVVLGVIAKQATDYQRATVILRNQRLPVIAIDTNPKDYAAFLNKNAAAPIYAYYPKYTDFNTVNWQSSAAHITHLKPRFTISPTLSSGIATEYGVWDYSWGIEVNAASHLWPGALVSATHVDHLESSEDFDTGVFRKSKIRSGIREMTFQQTFKLGSLAYTTIHLGHFRYDYKGLHSETLIHSPSGTNQLAFKYGSFEHKDTQEEKDYHLGSYRFYIPKYDVAIKATAGKFWNDDEGYRINSLFRFGDQTVDLFYKNTEAEFIGIAWTLPLTPEKDWSSKFLQVKGNEAWRWGFQTRIGEEHNNVAFSVANIPTMEWEIERTYLNNDKMSPEYVYQNLQRLKENSITQQ